MKQGKKKKNAKKRKKKIQANKKNIKKKVSVKNRQKKNTSKKKKSNVKNKQNVSNLPKVKKSTSFEKESTPIEKKSVAKKFIQIDFSVLLKFLSHLKEKIINLWKKIPFQSIQKKYRKLILKIKSFWKKISKINFRKKIHLHSSPKKKAIIKKEQKISLRTKRAFILVSIFCLIFALILMFPFGVSNYKSEASGKILDVPKFSILSEECCMYNATFKSIRSYSSLKLELANIMKQYQQISCDGKKYYYNSEDDFTITEYGLKKGLLFNTFYITYNKGNVCEVDSVLKRIELLPDNYSLDDAKKDGCYVIDNHQEFNVSSYNQFIENKNLGKESTLRIVTTSEAGDVIITDLQYLSDGKYKVTYDGTRDSTNQEADNVMVAYIYEHIGVYKNKLYAYNGKNITDSMLNTNNAYYLFDVAE